jgi:O-antigen/teichoic acid export membrane protein
MIRSVMAQINTDQKSCGVNSNPITTSKRLIFNTVFNLVTLISNAVIGFFLMRFFLGKLGQARYGLWLLFGGLLFRYGSMLSMGLNSAVNRYIPVYLAKGDREGIQRAVNTIFAFYSVLAVVLVGVSVFLHYNVSSWFTIKPELVSTATVLVLIVGFSCALAVPLQLSSAVLSGLQRYDIINAVMLMMVLIRTMVLVILLSRGYGLLTMGFVWGASEIAMRGIQAIFARKLLPQFVLSFTRADLKLFREMLAYGINTFLYVSGALIIYKSSSIVIGIFLGTEQVCQFEFAVAGVLLLSQFLQAFTAAIKPAVSDLDARGDQSRVREIAFLTQKYSLLMIVPGGCFLVVMGREFLQAWVGEKFGDPAIIGTMASVIAVLALGHCLRLSQHSNFVVLVGRGQHRIFGMLTALMALFCVLGSVVAVKVLNMGLLGIALANFVPMTLTSGLILPIYFNWKMKISIRDSILHVWWPALLGCIPSVAVISVWKYLAPPDSWSELFAVVFIAAGLTFACGWFFSLSTLERSRFIDIIRTK